MREGVREFDSSLTQSRPASRPFGGPIVAFRALILVALAASACGRETKSDDGEVGEPQIIEPWVRQCSADPPLPAERTEEPCCDGIDNDGDGYTDPHSPNIFCDSDCDCPADADCHAFQELVVGPHGEKYTAPGCNHPHTEGDAKYGECFGVLCPENETCWRGECLPFGDAGPCEPCDTGADCAPHSRCIAQGGYMGGESPETKLCFRDCGREPCPDIPGIACAKTTTVFESPTTGITHLVDHFVCLPVGQGTCIED